VSRAPRDLQAERAAIQAAVERLLTGAPRRATTGKLSATELITESGLARWKVYEHRDLIEQYQARVTAAGAVPALMQHLTVENQRLATELAEIIAALKPNRRAPRCCDARLPKPPSSWNTPGRKRRPTSPRSGFPPPAEPDTSYHVRPPDPVHACHRQVPPWKSRSVGPVAYRPGTLRRRNAGVRGFHHPARRMRHRSPRRGR
jgi:hypothetical protein